MTPKTRVRQLAPAIAVAVLLLALGACEKNFPNSTFNHHTDFNTASDALWMKLLGWGTFVFVFVESILIFTVIKFRKRPGSPPVQMTHGNTKMEIAWTVLPIVILIIIAIPTVQTIFKTQAKAVAGSLEIEVIGHQWWWEYKYPQYGFSTANEFYIPTGRTVNFTLTSKDVIHSFWVPQMGGKRDVVPNRTNHIWYTPNADLQSMVWNGFCTEYCGSSHANMRIRAYTVSPAEFESWAAGQKLPAAFAVAEAAAAPAPGAPAGKAPAKPPAKSGGSALASAAPGTMVAAVGGDVVTQTAPAYVFPADKLPDYAVPKTPYPDGLTFDDALLTKGDATRGRELFSAGTTAMCKSCHALNGIPGAMLPLAPNLTHLASRHTIAAGLYPNDPPHLARWIKDAPLMKPGAKMDAWGTGLFDPMQNKIMGSKGTMGALTDQQIADLVAFLLTLK